MSREDLHVVIKVMLLRDLQRFTVLSGVNVYILLWDAYRKTADIGYWTQHVASQQVSAGSQTAQPPAYSVQVK